MPAHRKPTPERYCEQCGGKLERKRLPNGDLEYFYHFLRRKFCSQTCYGLSIRKDRSDGNWSSAHTMARARMPLGPCEKCGRPDARDVHHRNGDHQDNRLENLERICRSCHNLEHRRRGSCVICGEPHKGHGYCNKHWIRWKKYGDPLAYKIPPRKACSVCGEPANAKGLCGMHYMQAKRAQQPR